MHCFSLTVCAFLLAGSAWAQSERVRALPAPSIALAVEEVRLPMASRGGRPVVEARVNGKGPYRFYFDTGASGPVVSQGLAQELKLDVIGELGVKSGGDAADEKPIPARLVHIDRLDLGAAKLSAVSIAAMDRARLGGAEAPVGVLSPAMFLGYLVSLDYPKKELRIRAGQLGPPDDRTLFAYLEGRMIPSLMVTIAGQTMEAHLDSGAAAGLSLPTRLAERLPLDGKPADSGKKARSIRGDFPVFEGKLKGRLSFGQYAVVDPTLEFSDVVQHANLGARLLERFVLTLDVKNRKFELVEGAAPPGSGCSLHP
jgi:predicted aspartyl protease